MNPEDMTLQAELAEAFGVEPEVIREAARCAARLADLHDDVGGLISYADEIGVAIGAAIAVAVDPQYDTDEVTLTFEEGIGAARVLDVFGDFLSDERLEQLRAMHEGE